MDQAATFKTYPHIGEKVFGYLTNHGDFKMCLFVCKSWNEILNNPTFWLNKLKESNQPDEFIQNWMDLVLKFKDSNLAKIESAISLRERYLLISVSVSMPEKILIPNEILYNPTFWLNKLKKLPLDVLIEDWQNLIEVWQNLINKLKNNDLAQKELAIGLREEYFIGRKRVNGKFWCRTCDVDFFESMNLYKHQQRKTHFLKAGLISMSEYHDNRTKFAGNKKLTICKLCGSSYEFYMDHLREFYHFDRGYEIPT